MNDVAVGGVEFEVAVLELAEALREEGCADEEHEGERGLKDDERALRSEAPEAVVRVPLRRASAGSACAAIHAGAMPKRTPVTSESAMAKPMTVGEGAALMVMLAAPGKASASSMRAPA